MRARWIRWSVAATAVVLSGCAESATLPRQTAAPHPARDALTYDDGSYDPSRPIMIKNAWIDINFPPAQAAYPADAMITAGMQYDAHHASISIDAALTGHTQNSQTSYGPYQNDTGTFTDNYFTKPVDLEVWSSCGTTLQAGGTFRAWWQIGPFRPDEKSEWRYETASQPACTASNAQHGGGGRVAYQYCKTTQVDYYWYYPDTNTYEFRYSDSTTECHAMA